jgi:hypothetical protein
VFAQVGLAQPSHSRCSEVGSDALTWVESSVESFASGGNTALGLDPCADRLLVNPDFPGGLGPRRASGDQLERALPDFRRVLGHPAGNVGELRARPDDERERERRAELAAGDQLTRGRGAGLQAVRTALYAFYGHSGARRLIASASGCVPRITPPTPRAPTTGRPLRSTSR